MPATKFYLLPLFLFLISTVSLAQTATTQVYVIRPNRYVGTAIPYKIYIDGKLVCNLNNNRFSKHDLEIGEHTATIQNTGISLHKMSEPIKIVIKEGQTAYLLVSSKRKLHLEEIGQASAELVLAKVKQDKNCLP